jgi:hypothetical protein
MNLELPRCQECPVRTAEIECRLEYKADQIVEGYTGKTLTQKEAEAAISTMALIGQQIGCPLDEILKTRKETQGSINPRLIRRDASFRPINGGYVPDQADKYFHERPRHRGESYDQWDQRRRSQGR